MNFEITLRLSPSKVGDESFIRRLIAKNSVVSVSEINHLELVRKSLDSRKKNPKYVLKYKVYVGEDPPIPAGILSRLKQVNSGEEIIIIGAGPAGYFAALKCLALGIKPVVLERGKDVRSRRRDLRAIQQDSIVNPDSNYCFGEGGAGTYSDGKLYTRSTKRGKSIEVLRLLVEHGASTDILSDAHPHIGSNKLPKIITNIRETIESHGGEIHFHSKVTDLIIENGKAIGVQINGEQIKKGKAIVLATGHSARDIFNLLYGKSVHMEAKAFALGVRIEHPQALINDIQYGTGREVELPPASYRLSCSIANRGVFSFCMCPGGLIVPAATSPGEIVVNGMSLSRRDSPFANAGTVVSIDPSDLKGVPGPEQFRCMVFQSEVERHMFESGDGSLKAPAQRLTHFLNRKLSDSLPESSYIPGLRADRLDKLLPDFVYRHLVQGIKQFGKQMKGYLTEEAVVVGTESRTSSPLRIPRDAKTRMHPEVEGLFPCGEGAGYAGGILSAAMDGQNVAVAVKEFVVT